MPSKRRGLKFYAPAGDIFRAEHARRYLADRVEKPIWTQEHDAMRAMLARLPDGLSVLDCPFGTGRFVDLFEAKGFEISGADISADMLDEARNELGPAVDRCALHVADATALPFPDKSFDLVVSVRFLESIVSFSDAKKCLVEFRRITRRYALLQLNNCLAIPAGRPPMPDDKAVKTYFTYAEKIDLLQQRGFRHIADLVVAPTSDRKGEKRLYFFEVV